MNKLYTLVLLVAFPITLSAGESINRTVAADHNGRVDVSVVRGGVKILGWDQSSVQVEGTLDDNTVEFVFERDGSEVELKVRIAKDKGGGGGSDLTVHVPVASQLDLNGVSTDYTLRGIQGRVEVQSISGDLVLEEVRGPAAANSVSGDVSIRASTGNLEVSSVSGDMKLEGQGRQFSLATVSGDIRLNSGKLEKLEAASVSGDISVQTGLSPAARVELESVSGDIALVLQDDIHARFDLETGPGGDIRNRINDKKPVQEKYSGAEALVFTAGEGSGRVEMETFSGTLSVSR